MRHELPLFVASRDASQEDADEPMCPTTLLMAHEEGDGVWPVASDMDAFLIGSRGMAFQRPLAEEQVRLFHW